MLTGGWIVFLRTITAARFPSAEMRRISVAVDRDVNFSERFPSPRGSYFGMTVAMSPPAEDWIPTRYSLLSRLQDWDDQESWKDFFDTCWRLIYAVALKSGATETEAQDVVQETVNSVAKDIHKFKRDRECGSFKGWLRNLTRWRIADRLRKRTKLTAPDES